MFIATLSIFLIYPSSAFSSQKPRLNRRLVGVGKVTDQPWQLRASTYDTSNSSLDAENLFKETSSALSTYIKYFAKSRNSFSNVEKQTLEETVKEIMDLSKDIESVHTTLGSFSSSLSLGSIKYARYSLLQSLMRMDYGTYVNVASFLSPLTIPRDELPNVQDIPFYEAPVSTSDEETTLSALSMSTVMNTPPAKSTITRRKPPSKTNEEDDSLVPDCELPEKAFEDNPLDVVLLAIFRNLVTQNSDGKAISDKPGIIGLLEQGRVFMLQPNQTAEAQHKMVRDTLGGLMTPVLPPVFRLFMSGIIPKRAVRFVKEKILSEPVTDEKDTDVQFGPWFYAPYFTTIVTPLFFQFLVGPSIPNARKDGTAGGLIVEKCKFLQESGCKGLCLHQCKLPAQQFFQDELGMPLTVSPNFETQECQWSFGEVPKPPQEDPSFPSGCLVGCDSRKAMKGTLADSDCG